ncbi:MAG: hypothetical protein CML39_00335 [Rhodobacteraceae bacterium]|nr:MAG: hypothetical protein CML39_00335 [Paracoccaceae bacterium]|tara:strand:- start:1182 stop:1823 length:642 start_codon:yes stop_codon:yes gene_type:complete
MRVSKNEIFQIARKACLADQIFEDYAEDIGQAIAHIHQNGFDGCTELETLLSAGETKPTSPPHLNSSKLVTRRLQPIKSAIPVIDWLLVKEFRKAFVSEGIDFPTIIIAQLARTANLYGGHFCIESKNTSKILKISHQYNYEDQFHSMWSQPQVELYWCKDPLSGGITVSKTVLCEVNPHIWEKLTARALKTYVPETEQSRLSGAGAGLVDND